MVNMEGQQDGFIGDRSHRNYLQSSDVVDFEDISIQQIGSILLKDTQTDIDMAEKVYCFIRNKIKPWCHLHKSNILV